MKCAKLVSYIIEYNVMKLCVLKVCDLGLLVYAYMPICELYFHFH